MCIILISKVTIITSAHHDLDSFVMSERLVLDTSALETSPDEDISSLPSPRLDTGLFEPFQGLPRAPLQRLPSSARPPAMFNNIYTSPPRYAQAPSSMDIVIPKRGEFVRQFSKIKLNRERPQRLYTPIAPAPEPLVEHEHANTHAPAPDRFLDVQDVYIAFTPTLKKTTWDRVKALGKGSFSKVILATPTLSQVQPVQRAAAQKLLVAVKITLLGEPHTKERAQLEEAIRRDIELVLDLRHPCLIDVFAFNIDNERALVVLPLIKGGDLFELSAKHLAQLGPALVSRIVRDVVDALAYMHASNVVHRDIKLENVLIDLPLSDLLAIDPKTWPHPVAIVTDLGLARRIDPKSPLLTTRCGSEDYVPPEIILSQPYDGRQTDMWALGVLSYALLEGRLPFDAPPRTKSGRVVRTSHRIARNDWAWYKVKDAPPEWQHLKKLVESCLRKTPRISAADVVGMQWYKEAGPPVVGRRSVVDPCDCFI